MSDFSNRIVELPLTESSSTVFDFEALWAEIEKCCSKVMEWASDGSKMSIPDATILLTTNYTLVYHLVSHPCSNYPKSDNVAMPENIQQMRAVFIRLKAFLDGYLKAHVQPALAERVCIERYICLWREYLVGVANLKTIFSPLTHTVPASGFDENPFDGAEDVAFESWKQCILQEGTCKMLSEQFSSIVRKERAGERSDCSALAVELKDSLTMLAEPDMYRRIVESTYSEDMDAYYDGQFVTELSSKFGSQQTGGDPVSYAAACCDAVTRETCMSTKYLQSKEVLLNKLIRKLVGHFVTQFSTSQLSALMQVDDARSGQNMRILYNFLSESREEGLPLLENIVKGFSQQQVQRAVKTDSRCLTDKTYKHFLTVLADIIAKLALFFNGSFAADDGSMVAAMEDGIAEAIKVLSTRVSFTSAADQLGVLANATLSTKSDAAELSIEDIVSIYYFLPDEGQSAKEAFLTRYQEHLAFRLLSGNFDLQAEHRALELLTEVKLSPKLFSCGSMLRSTARKTIAFAPVKETTVECAITPIVLPRGTWPLSAVPPPKLPGALDDAIQLAKAECARLQPGRTLTADFTTSSGTVCFFIQSEAPRRVHLRLSLPQICILHLFNQPDKTWTEGDIAKAVGCSAGVCNAALGPLLRAHVLQSGPTGVRVGDGGALKDGDTVNLVPELVAGLHAVAGTSSMHTPSPQMLYTEAIQARIVASLKAHGPQDLNAIEDHLQAGLPTPPPRDDVKKCLERLIERGVVQRASDGATFCFIP